VAHHHGAVRSALNPDSWKNTVNHLFVCVNNADYQQSY
jgi:hypothetical protein